MLVLSQNNKQANIKITNKDTVREGYKRKKKNNYSLVSFPRGNYC